MDMVRPYQSINTAYNADSTEWCPVQGYHNTLLCGTYQLEEEKDKDKVDEPQTRVGRLYVYTLEELDKDLQLKETGHIDMPGILDIKWSHNTIQGQTLFALVNSIGQLRLYRLQEDKSVCMMEENELTTGSLGLSLEWNNMVASRSQTRIASSDSAGCIHVHQLDNTSLQTLTSWKAHDFEAWITAFDQWNTDILYTGGDDCRLKGWDLRMDLSTPVLNSKRHSMGVCSIQSNPVRENILATGSYDEQLILWDTRSMKRPLSDCGLGGGIWRIKWEPDKASHILTATMYNGFHIIDTTNIQDPKVTYHYTSHDSIGYGADWCRKRSHGSTESAECDTSSHVIATCSFYDHLLTLWSFNPFPYRNDF